MRAKRLAHRLGLHRAAAERHHGAAGAGQQLQHDLLLTRAEGGLALTVEERLDRLAEAPLELLVRVERRDAQLRGRRACRRGLAGAHEAHEHQGALPGAGARRLIRGYAGLHPIRSV
jgi:hypothetical protein